MTHPPEKSPFHDRPAFVRGASAKLRVLDLFSGRSK